MNIMGKTATVLAMLGLGAMCGFGAATNGGSGGGSGSTTFSGTLTLTQPQFDDYFVYDANNGALTGADAVGQPLPSNIPIPVSKTVNVYINSGVASLIGLYQPGGVGLAVNQTVFNSAVNNESWSQLFSDPTYSEQNIATALTNGDGATLQNFLTKYSTDFVSFSSGMTTPVTGGILDFSNATNGGSLTVDSVVATCGVPSLAAASLASGCGNNGGGNPGTTTPEPATELLLCVGLGVVALTARKLRKA